MDLHMAERLSEMECPQCKAVYEDFDGVGVIYCENCGYCEHASITGDTCDYCGLEGL